MARHRNYVYIIGILVVLAASAGFSLLGGPVSREITHFLFGFDVLAVFAFIKPVAIQSMGIAAPACL